MLPEDPPAPQPLHVESATVQPPQVEPATLQPPLVEPTAPRRPHVVGIGSSAGGLEALTQLLPGLPAGPDLRYVIVQHMSPTHRSMLAQLLGRTTSMEVLEIIDGTVPEAGRIYVTPPNANVMLQADGSLRLVAPPAETVPKPSINVFFSSLAEVMADHAIGIVLSGTGSDGATGLYEIKAVGGYAFAQEPGGARYDGMVRAAIDGGGVDSVLPAEAMGAEIARIVQQPLAIALDHSGPSGPSGAASVGALQLLLRALYAQTRIDFTGYKEPTLLRRIERRMAAARCLTLEQYTELAVQNPRELQALAQDMLISVTSFYRDRHAFDRLRDELRLLLQRKPPGEDLRIWVAGCASGEEAYSIAIELHGLMPPAAMRRLQIFATDIDEAALARARRGVFATHVLQEMDPALLERHFRPHADGYEVGKTLRDMVLFARHNLVQDPPFLRLDLVSCRNVLIYLQPALQARVLGSLHYALNPGGLLFLGRSEGVHGGEGLFDVIDRGSHLFRRGPGGARGSLGSVDREPPQARGRQAAGQLEAALLRATSQRFAPPSLLVDLTGAVRQTSGDLGGLMALPEGRPDLQLMSLLVRELRPEVARLVRRVQDATPPPGPGARGAAPQPPEQGRWRRVRALGRGQELRVSVQRISDGLEAPMLLVCFERRTARGETPAPLPPGSDEAAASQTALEEQLASTREHLYTVIEELETTNEESQALAEEVQTANQELQATNEELEASNEEMQASNEELTTVNEELQIKSNELLEVNGDLESIYATVDFPLLAFDERQQLTRANRAAQLQLGFDSGCVGRAVYLLPWPQGMPSLRDDFDAVLARGQTVTRQLLDVGDRHWSLRMVARQSATGTPSGVLLQMQDNTRLYDSEQVAARSHARLRQLVERSSLLVCLCDPAGRLMLANPNFERCHRLEPGGAVGRLATDVLSADRVRSFRDGLAEAMRRMAPFEAEERVTDDIGTHELLASYYPLLDDDGAVSAICYQALDVTQHRRAEAELLLARSARLAAEGMARTKSGFLANMSHEIRTPMNAVIGLTRLALEAPLPDAARDHLVKAQQAAQALMRILDDVLDYSKIESGQLRFESRPFRPADVLARVRDLFSANAEQKGLGLSIDAPLGVPAVVLGDPLRLSQVLNNLVGNAVKFTERGEVRIALSVLPGAEPGHCLLRFTVRDTGIGMDAPTRDRLFEAFSQGDDSVTRRFGGTGLGLAICRRLVELMGGQIGVNSELGQGSEFWLSAPFELGAEPPPTDPDPAAPAGRERLAGFQGLHVLVAEDNPLNQLVTQAALDQLGMQATMVDDGQQALDAPAAAPDGHFDLVLMDMHMPRMDGLEATRRMRALPQGRTLLIVAVTAAALAEDRSLCLQAGMNDHISKPFDAAQLGAVLRRLSDGVADAAVPAPHAVVVAPPVLRGFDLSTVLQRLQGNEPVLWELLQQFVARESATADELTGLLGAGRTADAQRRAHALVGSALAVGATAVSRTAAALESALDAGLAGDGALLAVRESLHAGLAQLRQALETRTSRSRPETP